MSFGVNVRAATKALVKATVAAQFAEVIDADPIHKVDGPVAFAAINNAVDALAADGRDIQVEANGVVSCEGDAGGNKVVAVTLNVRAYLVNPPVAEPYEVEHYPV